MSWRRSLADLFSDLLRLIARACVLLDLIIIGVFSVWLTTKLCLKLMRWLNEWLFD